MFFSFCVFFKLKKFLSEIFVSFSVFFNGIKILYLSFPKMFCVQIRQQTS